LKLEPIAEFWDQAIVRLDNPLKQGLKHDYQVAPPLATSPPGQSIKTRVEACRDPRRVGERRVRLDNPLKQGLKHGPPKLVAGKAVSAWTIH